MVLPVGKKQLFHPAQPRFFTVLSSTPRYTSVPQKAHNLRPRPQALHGKLRPSAFFCPCRCCRALTPAQSAKIGWSMKILKKSCCCRKLPNEECRCYTNTGLLLLLGSPVAARRYLVPIKFASFRSVACESHGVPSDSLNSKCSRSLFR